ncbi:MAG: carboxypeptidase regulatory-like domain-containing protein [Acidobacteriaceae bacterium]
MKRAWLLLLLLGAWPRLAPAQAQQPTMLTVAAGHSSIVAWPGVTAAYSTDPDTVQAEAVPGGVRITAKAPGEANVILVVIGGTRTISVTVPAPPHSFSGGSGAGNIGPGQTVEFGNYEVRYSSNPTQITNIEDVTQIAGKRQIHIQIMNSDIFPANDQAPVGFPLLSYQISHPGRSLTLVDQLLDNSPLTVNQAFLRGVHFQTSKWEFHAGITSVATFQDFLLPSNRYEIAGLSRHFSLNKYSSLEGNLYYMATDTSVNTDSTPGPLATLYYQYHHLNSLDAVAEIGVGNGYAVSGQIDRERKTQSLHAFFQYQSPKVATFSLSALHGRIANFNWQKQFGPRFLTVASASDTDVNLPNDKQLVDTATLNQTYTVTKHIGLSGGLVTSRFAAVLPAAPTITSAGYFVGPQLQWQHFGGSLQFQQQNNSGNNPDSTDWNFTAQTTISHLGISANYVTQTETPVLAPIQSSTEPDLRQELNRESAAVLNPVDMGRFFQQTSHLSAQGFIDPVTFGLATRRDQYGLNVQWANQKTGQLNFNGMINSSEGGNMPSLRLTIGSANWTRKFGVTNTLNASFSLSRSSTPGQIQWQPLEQFSFQHQLNSIPRFLVPGHRGIISGHVFIDNNYAQAWQSSDTPIADVLIYLDGRRTTHTDAHGYFVFRGVPYGVHSIEVHYQSSRAFYYTSSSPKSVPTGGTADFGISFAKGRIFGSFTNDAGAGIQVRLALRGPGIQRDIATDNDGTVEVDGLPYGTYTVTPDPSSFPPGYSLSDLTDQTIVLTATQAAHFNFRIKAQRSISGRVQLFDPATGRTQPLAGVTVALGSGQTVVHTDSEGRYLFRQLPAGSYDVTVVHDGKLWSRSVELDPTPDVAADVNITITQPSSPASEPALPVEPPPASKRPRRERPRPRDREQSRKREAIPPAAQPASAGTVRP